MTDQGQGSLFTQETVRHGSYERTEYKPHEGAVAHQPHSDTSFEAAERIRPDLNALQTRVFLYITAQGPARELNGEVIGGATDDEQQQALAMNPSTQRPRRVELENMGHVRDSGYRRPTRTGRSAVVWEAT